MCLLQGASTPRHKGWVRFLANLRNWNTVEGLHCRSLKVTSRCLNNLSSARLLTNNKDWRFSSSLIEWRNDSEVFFWSIETKPGKYCKMVYDAEKFSRAIFGVDRKWVGSCYFWSVQTRGVNDSGLESAPEYEFGSFLEILDGDSGSGSFLVWSRFQPGIGSTSEAGTKFPCWRLNIHNFGHICLSFCLNKG